MAILSTHCPGQHPWVCSVYHNWGWGVGCFELDTNCEYDTTTWRLMQLYIDVKLSTLDMCNVTYNCESPLFRRDWHMRANWYLLLYMACSHIVCGMCTDVIPIATFLHKGLYAMPIQKKKITGAVNRRHRFIIIMRTTGIYLKCI